jgi:hypothetical protein
MKANDAQSAILGIESILKDSLVLLLGQQRKTASWMYI